MMRCCERASISTAQFAQTPASDCPGIFDALESLRAQLELAEFTVTPALLARRPWITGQPPVSRVLSDGRRFVQRLELAPKRKSAGPKLRKTRAARAALRHDKIGV